MKKLIKWIQTKLGYKNCEACKEWIYPVFIKDWIFDPEEPPMFAHYNCPKCGATSEQLVNPMMDEVAKKEGYLNFQDFIEKFYRKKQQIKDENIKNPLE